MLCNSLHELSRHESSVHEEQSSQQAKRVDETHKSRVVVDLQRCYQRRKSVRLAHVFAVRRVCHMLGPANGKCDNIFFFILNVIYTVIGYSSRGC